jgi:hypothetical protein
MRADIRGDMQSMTPLVQKQPRETPSRDRPLNTISPEGVNPVRWLAGGFTDADGPEIFRAVDSDFEIWWR